MHFCIFLLIVSIYLIYECRYYIIWFIEFNAFTFFAWLNTFALKSALNNIKNKVSGLYLPNIFHHHLF